MQTAHELMLHGLSDILDGERQLVNALEKNAEQASRPELKKAFESHQAQTQKQVERLQQVFESLGEQPEDAECKGIKGLIEEHETFMEEEEPSPDLADIESVIGAAKIEAYEIHEYEGLIRLAQQMGHRKAVQLLKQNLREEQQTLKKMQGFSKKLKPDDMGMEEEQEEQPRAGRGRSRRAA